MDSICDANYTMSHWAFCSVVAIPHALYAFIWLRPHIWWSWFEKQSVDVLASTASFIKLMQFTAGFLWFATQNNNSFCFDPTEVAAWRWVAFCLLGAAGQSLNVAVYTKLGRKGVYYGCRLGHKIPWVTGFPFNVVSHAQYLGSALSLIACACIFSSAVPAVWLATLYWCSLYGFSAAVETVF